MSNESIIQVPPNVGEPIVLQRFLLRLVEELDILLGKRAGATNDQYVAQQQLLETAVTLTTAVTDAQEQLNAATDLLNQAIDNARLNLEAEVDDIQAEQLVQNADIDALENFSWLRAFTLGFQGRATNGAVTFNVDYNVASGTRTAVGVYEFELTNVIVDGDNILAYTQQVTSYTIADSVTSEDYTVKFAPIDLGLGTFSVSVFAIEQGAGNKLVFTPYDPLSTDNVNVLGMFTPPGVTVPTL